MSVSKARKLRSASNGAHNLGWRHTDSCPHGHRSFFCASLGSAAPGGYCHASSFDNQTNEALVGLPLAYKNPDSVGHDRVTEPRVPHLNGGRSKREAQGLELWDDKT